MARGSWLVGAAQRAARCGNPVESWIVVRGSWFVVRGSWSVGAAQRAARCGNPVGGPLFAAVLFTGFRRAALWDGPYYGCGPSDRGGLCLSTLFTAGSPRGAPTGAFRGTAAACVYTAFVTFASWPAASMARTKDGGMSSFFRDWPMRRPRMTPLLL